MTRWKCTYQGKPDPHSKSGCAQPSWHTFDKRVWVKGDYTITLVNLTNQGHGRVKGKIATYRAVLKHGSRMVATEEGHDWQALVRLLKGLIS